MTTSVTLSNHDWSVLYQLHYAAHRNHPLGVGAIWLCENDDELVAAVETSQFHVTVRLGIAAPGEGFAEPLDMRPLLLINSLGDEDGHTTIKFDNATATATVAGTTLSVDQPTSTRLPELYAPPAQAMAVVDAHEAAQGFATIALVPFQASNDSAEHTPVWISIIDSNEIVFSRNWETAGRTTVRIPGELRVELTEELHAATTTIDAISPLIYALSSPDEKVAIDLTADDGYSIAIANQRWTLKVRTVDNAAHTAIATLLDHLETTQRIHEQIADNSVVIGEYPHLVRVDTYGHINVNIRCSTVIANNIEQSAHLFEELNQINLGLSDINIWFQDNKIIIGKDTTTTNPHKIVEVTEQLRTRATQLAPALTAFALTS